MDIKIEIGENLYLVVQNVNYKPGRSGYISGPPEKCYEAEPAECDWQDDNCKLVIRKKICVNFTNIFNEKKVKMETQELEFECDPNLASEYYDEILEAIEEKIKCY